MPRASFLNALLAISLVAMIAVIGAVVWIALGDDDGGDAQFVSDSNDSAAPTSAQRAELDDSTDLPGQYVPTQGRAHMSGGFHGHVAPPFCTGVAASDTAADTVVSTPISSAAAIELLTPKADQSNCYASNPPTSGRHLNVERGVEVEPGVLFHIPLDPGVYPSEIQAPRASIPHILEHAGVYVGWHCEDGEQECLDVIAEIERVVNDRIDQHDERVVMTINRDLPAGHIGLAAWTRVDVFPYEEYTEARVAEFTSAHSCRFDPEGFC